METFANRVTKHGQYKSFGQPVVLIPDAPQAFPKEADLRLSQNESRNTTSYNTPHHVAHAFVAARLKQGLA
jgi:hypothetical protein